MITNQPALETTPSLSVETLTSLADLESLRAEWWDLWQRCPDATPFQSPAWTIAWWKHLGRGELCALALRRNQRLVALAPWFTYQADNGVRRLLLLGTGVSDYLDLLVEPEFSNDTQLLVSEWLGQDAAWDSCEFRQLTTCSTLLNFEVGPEYRTDQLPDEVCPVLKLPARIDDLDQVVPKAMLKNVRYYRHRLGKKCSFEIESASLDTFPSVFETLLKLHRARWAERALPGVLSDSRFEAFHREAAGELLTRQVLRFYTLSADGQIVAVLYGFCHRQRTMFYLSGFDPEWSSFSPGVLLIAHTIEQAVLEGCHEFDFLRGNEPYKYLWGAADRATRRVTLLRAIPV